MSTINPKFSNPEPIKHEIDRFQSVTAERVKNMKMEAELGNLARERDLLKKQVDVLEKTQRYLELEKCSLEEKLGRSERRCEELEKKIEKARQKKLNLKEKLDWSRTKCEELRRKEIESARAVDELRLKKMESGHAHISNVAQSKASAQDNEVKRSAFRGASTLLTGRCHLRIIDAKRIIYRRKIWKSLNNRASVFC